MRARARHPRVATGVLEGRALVPAPKETSIVNAILEALRWDTRVAIWRQNTGAMKLPGGPSHKARFVRFGAVGQADISGLITSTGRRLEIEVKRPGEDQRDSQRTFQRVIEKAGGVYVVVHSLEECRAKLDAVIAEEDARYMGALTR